jgi:serine/threonine-protein kinase
VDVDVARLVSEQRLAAAAELASQRGDARTASELFERACSFRRAAEEALRAFDPERALGLAADAEDDELASEAMRQVLEKGVQGAAAHMAAQLELRGHAVWAARLYQGLGQSSLAARAFEHGGEPVRAAALHEAAHDPARASTVLEAAARREPDRWEVHIALGSLLFRYGKAEAAVRALQKVPAGSSHHRAALTYLVPALERLGFSGASGEAAQLLASYGGPVDSANLAKATADVKSRLFGRYEVVREVASTPSARVLECYDGVRREKVAVKIFAAYDSRGAGRDALARFEREVRVLGALEHPNVVPLRDYLPEGPALVLAWMEGGTLEARIAEGGLAPARAVEIACAVLSALGEAHRVDILHRDVKPANVLFDDAGVARLGDFGVAHLGDLSATATAGVFGTLAYMSPEQREGRPATVQSDLFGVGVLLFEMLTGERPHFDESRTMPSGAHRQLGPGHDAAVLRLFARDPSERPEGAFDARRTLLSLSWPDAVDPAPFAKHTTARPAKPTSMRPSADRLEEAPDGAWVDRWLERSIVHVSLTPQTLARASAFARAGHPALQAVLRVDHERGQIWLEAPRGERAARPLNGSELEEARAALDALHRAEGAHGSVDSEHVLVGRDGVMILFAQPPDPGAAIELDRAALGRLARAMPSA